MFEWTTTLHIAVSYRLHLALHAFSIQLKNTVISFLIFITDSYNHEH